MKSLGIVALLLPSLTMTAQNLQPIRLPANPGEVIITADWHDYWGDRTRTNNNPVLTIHGDGRIRVSPPQGTNELTDRLSADELQDLLRFIVLEQRFLEMEYHALEGTGGVSISDAAETFLRVKTADGERQVNFYALAFYARLLPVADYPGLKFLAQLRAIETRLQRLVETVRANGKQTVLAALAEANVYLARESPGTPAFSSDDSFRALPSNFGNGKALEFSREQFDGGVTTFVFVVVDHDVNGQPRVRHRVEVLPEALQRVFGPRPR